MVIVGVRTSVCFWLVFLLFVHVTDELKLFLLLHQMLNCASSDSILLFFHILFCMSAARFTANFTPKAVLIIFHL